MGFEWVMNAYKNEVNNTSMPNDTVVGAADYYDEYIQGNTKSYIPNPSCYDAANVSRFERLTITMISDGSISLQLYQNRELDEVDLGESSITTIQADPSNEYNEQLCEKRPKKFSYCFIFNYDERSTDGTPDENWNKAIANKAFRQCFSKGLELSKFYARFIFIMTC